MALSFDVNLPKSRVPRWPDECVACGREATGKWRIVTHSIGWYTLLTWSFGALFWAEVPTCSVCRPKLQWRRSIRIAVTSLCTIGAAAAAVYLLGSGYRGPLRKWLAMSIAILILLPMFLWEAFWPPPIALTAFKDTVDYEFHDAAYAERFAKLNDGVVK